MVTDSLVKKKFVHETLTRSTVRYRARTAPSSCASFLISVSSTCSIASATTASASSSAGTWHCITA